MVHKSHLTAQFRVYWHDTDKHGRMSFAAISRYLQETAWQHAESMGFGYEKAKAFNQFWVLVRQKISIQKFPVWNDLIFIETWPRGVDGIWAFRDYLIRDKNRQVIGGVASSWMVIDLNTHRPQKPELVKEALPYTDPAMALDAPASRITFTGDGELLDIRSVKFSDIDLNGHATNSKYAEWIADALSVSLKNCEFNTYHINFISEAHEGEEIEIRHLLKRDLIKIKATRKSDGRTVFIAELI